MNGCLFAGVTTKRDQPGSLCHYIKPIHAEQTRCHSATSGQRLNDARSGQTKVLDPTRATRMVQRHHRAGFRVE
jgi:hypothetical protein